MGGSEEQGRNLPGTHTSPTEDMEDHSASPATCQALGAHVMAVKFQTNGHQKSFCKGPDKHLEPFSHTCILLHILIFFLQPFKHVKSILK